MLYETYNYPASVRESIRNARRAALRVKTRNRAIRAMRAMQGQKLTTARMLTVNQCIRAAISGDWQDLPSWALALDAR